MGTAALSPIHWAGLILAGGAVALGVALVLVSTRPVIEATLSPGVAALVLLASALLLLALPAVYAVQAQASGTLGLVGHVLLEIGLLLPVLVSATPLLHPEQNGPVGEHPLVFGLGIALALGLLLTAIATYQADVLPRSAAVAVLGAMVGFFFVFFVAEFLPPTAGQVGTAVFGVLLAVGLAWMGLGCGGGPPQGDPAAPAIATVRTPSLVRAVEAQHTELHSAIDAVTSACRLWRDSPSSETAEALGAYAENLRHGT